MNYEKCKDDVELHLQQPIIQLKYINFEPICKNIDIEKVVFDMRKKEHETMIHRLNDERKNIERMIEEQWNPTNQEASVQATMESNARIEEGLTGILPPEMIEYICTQNFVKVGERDIEERYTKYMSECWKNIGPINYSFDNLIGEQLIEKFRDNIELSGQQGYMVG